MPGLGLPQAGLSLLAGGLTTLSPCVLPLLPLVLSGALQGHRLAPLAMGLGMLTSFAGLGLLLGAFGPALGLEADSLRTLGGWLLIVFALLMLLPALGAGFGQWLSPLANAAHAASARFSGGSLAGAALLGALLSLVWSPCSGPLLGAALTLVASEGGAWRGALLLGLFGLGAATPLVAVAYLSRAGFMRLRDRLLLCMPAIRRVFALLLGLLGVAILSGADRQLEAWLLQHLPAGWLRLSTGI